MALFDRCIERVDGYVDRMRTAGRQVIELSSVSGSPDPLSLDSLPLRVGPGAGTGLVMKSETYLELGSPTAGSCALALYTERTSLVQNSRIRVVGPDVRESPMDTMPFGQVIIAAGEDLTEADYPALLECQHVGDWIEGFMVKSRPGCVWARVSTEAAGRGFGFRFLGSALIALVRSRVPKAEVIEILFVTSSKADLQPLKEIEASVSEIGRAMKERRWKERGIDISECAFSGSCDSCSEKAVCDEVRKLAHMRGLL